MPHWSIPLTAHAVRNTTIFDDPGNAVWFATHMGEIRWCQLYDAREGVAGAGYDDICGLHLAADGLGLYVAEAAGNVLLVARDEADAAAATTVFQAGETVVAMAAHPATARLLVLTAAGALLSINPESSSAAPLSTAFESPLAMTVDREAGLVAVLEDASPGRRLRVFELATWSERPPIDLSAGIGSIFATRLEGYEAVLAADEATGFTELVGLGGELTISAPPLGAPVTGLAGWYSVVIATTPAAIVAYEWGISESIIKFRMLIAPAWVGGYIHGEVDLGAAGLLPADVEIRVGEGPDAGYVSSGLEPGRGDGIYRFIVCAAMQPGEFHVVCNIISDGTILGKARFRVVAHWPDSDSGPGIVLTGKQELFAKGSWGGGPNGPQNINKVPAPERWRVLLVLVELKNSSFTAGEIAASRSSWSTALVGAPPPAPPMPSVRAYYDEASLFTTPGPTLPRGTTIDLVTDAVLGPIKVDIAWADALEPKNMTDSWAGWNPKPTFWQECANAISTALADNGTGHTILPACDAITFLVRTESSNVVVIGTKLFPAKYVWPWASGATFWWKTALSTSFMRKPIVLMPDTLPSSMPADRQFNFVTAMAHELGHTIGLEDLYNRGDFSAEVAAREVANLDLMSAVGAFPHFSLPNKMRLGWIAPDWIQRFDFGQNPNGAPVVLHAVEALTRNGPPGGRKAGIEVRIQDGWNYYFEYRRTIAGLVGDQLLNTTDGGPELVVGTDVKPDGKVEPARPVILRLPVDADGEGPVLNASGEDYEETDVTNIARLHDFRLVFEQIDPGDPNAAHVRVEYVRAHRPELQISPAPGRGNWKSPDIDLKGPAGDNRVAKGLKHRIVARVRNAGSKGANNVRVTFDWLPFTVSPGAWVSLGAAPLQNVAPGTTATFEMEWNVPASLQIDNIEVEHFCVKVNIDRYVDPLDPNQSEIVIHNNWAQSNFDTQGLGHGSPSERHWTGLAVANRVHADATYYVLPEQESEHFRLFIGNAWVRMTRDEERIVPVACESLAGDLVHGADFEVAFAEGQFERPPQASFNAFASPPDSLHCTSPSLVWGAGLALRPGLRTWVGDLRRSGEVVLGRVVGSSESVAHALTEGDVNVVVWFEDRPEEQFEFPAEVEADGSFAALLPGHIMVHVENERLWGDAIYLGTHRYTLSRSGPTELG
jgi:hypothetical protein